MHSDSRLQVDTSCAVIVDVQDRLYPHMADAGELERRIIRLIHGLHLLGVQLLATEQYPKGLGHTLPEIRTAIEQPPAGSATRSAAFEPIEKVCFSCVDSEPFFQRLDAVNRRNVAIAGIEAHVCVQQTSLDLIARGYRPVIVADCISSRNRYDMEVAVERLRSAGATITTSEALLFELCRFAGTDTFKQISKLVK